MTTKTTEIELRKAENGSFQIEKVVKKLDKRQLPKYLDKDVILARIDDMPPGRDKMLVITMWRTGCRVSEVTNIKKKDIDFKNRTIRISWLKSRKWLERVIPLQKGLADLLAVFCTALNMDDRLFPYTRQNVLKITKKWLKVSPHKIRHSYTINLIRQGVQIQDLQKLLGHKNINTTMIYYSISPEQLKSKIDEVDFG